MRSVLPGFYRDVLESPEYAPLNDDYENYCAIDPASQFNRHVWHQRITIAFAMLGSHAYGTNVATSDRDFMGIYFNPWSVRCSFRKCPNHMTLPGHEVKMYELSRFFELAIKCNPNILEILWVDGKLIEKSSRTFQHLVRIRQMFLSKRAFYSYAGYAESQKKKLETFKSANPDRARLREEFGYDTKYAMHLIRLLRMLHEIIKSGTLVVTRPDAEELKDIRAGAWSKERVLREAQLLEDSARTMLVTSKLPEAPYILDLNKELKSMYYSFDKEYFDFLRRVPDAARKV